MGFIGPVPTKPDAVLSGSTFDVAVDGYDTTNLGNGMGFALNDAGYLIGPFTPTFGQTLTIPDATSDGETATITSSETIGATTTTDTVTVSVPTRFVPVGTTFSDGDIINEEDLEIGFDTSSDGLTFASPVTGGITATGTANYEVGGLSEQFTFSAGDVYTELDPTDTILAADEGIETFTDDTDETAADLTSYNISSFSFAFTYPNPSVPEPSSGMVGLMIGLSMLRRRDCRVGGAKCR